MIVTFISSSSLVTPTMTHGTPPDSVNYTGYLDTVSCLPLEFTKFHSSLMNPSTAYDGCCMIWKVLRSLLEKDLFLASHWALSPVAIFEYWSNMNKTNQVFSAQAIVDCAPKKPANGCNGAGTNIGLGFEYAIGSGLPDGNKYKYKASFGTCQAPKNPSIWYLSNYCTAQLNGNEAVLQSIVAVYGPMMIQLVLDIQTAQKSYKSGVFSSDNCSATKTCDRQFFVGFRIFHLFAIIEERYSRSSLGMALTPLMVTIGSFEQIGVIG